MLPASCLIAGTDCLLDWHAVEQSGLDKEAKQIRQTKTMHLHRGFAFCLKFPLYFYIECSWCTMANYRLRLDFSYITN